MGLCQAPPGTRPGTGEAARPRVPFEPGTVYPARTVPVSPLEYRIAAGVGEPVAKLSSIQRTQAMISAGQRPACVGVKAGQSRVDLPLNALHMALVEQRLGSHVVHLYQHCWFRQRKSVLRCLCRSGKMAAERQQVLMSRRPRQNAVTSGAVSGSGRPSADLPGTTAMMQQCVFPMRKRKEKARPTLQPPLG